MSTTVTPAASVSAQDFDFPAPGTPGYAEFRKTGKLPEHAESTPAPVQEEVRTPEPEPEVTPDQEDTAEIAAVPAPAPAQRGKKDAAARLQEVLADRKRDRELIRQLTEKLTTAPSVAPHSQAAAEVKPEPQAKAKPKIGDVDAQGKPVFKTYGEYEDARDEWNRTELLRLVEEKTTKQQQSREAADAERVIAEGFGTKVSEARKKYPDFDAVALNTSLPISKGSAIDNFIVESPYGPDVLYHLGQNPGELHEMLRFNPVGQVRALIAIEQQFTAAPVATPAPKPPVKTLTAAPRPPHQVSGKSPTPDPLAKAVQEGDQRLYSESVNERDPRLLAVRARRK